MKSKQDRKDYMIIARLNKIDYDKFIKLSEKKRRNKSDMLRIIIQDFLYLYEKE